MSLSSLTKMDAENSITEFRVFNAKSNKEKALRVIVVNEVPNIQLKSLKGDHLSEINISSAPKLFLPILSEKKHTFQIILKEKSIQTFYCNDKDNFEKCVQCINRALVKYHTNRDSMDSVCGSARSSTSSKSESSTRGSVGMSRTGSQNVFPEVGPKVRKRISSQPVDTNTYMEMNAIAPQMPDFVDNEVTLRNVRPPNIVRRSTFTLEEALSADYVIPTFDHSKPPLKDSNIQLKERNSREIPVNVPEIIKDVLLLRQEITHPGGVEVTCNDVLKKIDVIEVDNVIWINIINVQNIPLQKTLHIGDRICCVNGAPVSKKVDFIQLCKADSVNLTIQRLPKARVFAMDNSTLRVSFKEMKFTNNKYAFNANSNNSYFITEIDFRQNRDSKVVGNLAISGAQYHAIIVHPSSFLKSLKIFRRSSLG